MNTHFRFAPKDDTTSPTFTQTSTAFRTFAVATFLGSLVCTAPVYCAYADAAVSSENVNTSSPTYKKHSDHDAANLSQETMAKSVEARIQTLHDKLGITAAQEAKWGDVSQSMRDNDPSISQLIQTRHQSPETMNAIDDLQSYENIAQAHSVGLKKLIPILQAL